MKWCEACKWWGRERAHDRNYPLGTCRVHPPTRGKMIVLPYHDPDRPEATGPMIEEAAWPWSGFDDWCGSYSEGKRFMGDDDT